MGPSAEPHDHTMDPSAEPQEHHGGTECMDFTCWDGSCAVAEGDCPPVHCSDLFDDEDTCGRAGCTYTAGNPADQSPPMCECADVECLDGSCVMAAADCHDDTMGPSAEPHDDTMDPSAEPQEHHGGTECMDFTCWDGSCAVAEGDCPPVHCSDLFDDEDSCGRAGCTYTAGNPADQSP